MVFNIISFFGIFAFIGIGWLFSTNRKKMNWMTILTGVGLQLIFALFIFVVPIGAKLFLWLNDIVIKIIDTSTAGTKFVFGSLAIPPGIEGSHGFILAFQSLPTIIFFSALISVLYYFNIMPMLIKVFASLFTRLMKVSGAESLSTASNIFVGVEASFTVKPHIPKMTQSELCTMLTAGMATVASNVLALYVFTLKDYFPTIAGHLISASILAAPAAIVMSKVMMPEESVPETAGVSIKPHYDKPANLFEAIINGSMDGVKMIVGVTALLIAVLGLVALVDLALGSAGSHINNVMHLKVDWSLKGIAGYLFYPFSIIMGVPPQDAFQVGKIVGERIIATEVAGYQDLALAISQNLIHNPRSIIISTYALCGFAHLASMAIFVGGISALVPGRTRDLSKIAVRALFAATFACCMTACVAGTFFTNSSILFGK
jgi:CNT family concentrative nucleoside transporter